MILKHLLKVLLRDRQKIHGRPEETTKIIGKAACISILQWFESHTTMSCYLIPLV